MTDKELQKLTRAELLELLLVQSKEIDKLNNQIEQLEDQVKQQKITITNAGSIAEAALQLNGIFEAAQAAADQYLESVTKLDTDTEIRCNQMLEQTRKECDELLESTRQRSRQVWEIIRKEMYNPRLDYPEWQRIAEFINSQLN